MTRTGANRARARRRITRRGLKATGGSTAALAATEPICPGGAHVAHASGHEVRGAKLGFIALSDAAALSVAKQQAVLLSDRIFMMTNGPAAHFAKVLEVALPRPRGRGPRSRARLNRGLAWLGS